ncbi:MAG: hypothetical protein WEA24_10045 [Gemmatimonadota bacterium]
MRRRTLAAALLLAAACGAPEDADLAADLDADLDAALAPAAEAYVKLVLALGDHDPAYVDAYYGPEEWRAEATASPPTAIQIGDSASALAATVAQLDLTGAEEDWQLRASYLQRQLEAVAAHADRLGGRTMSFDEEARALYDVDPPEHTAEEFQAILDRLDERLPGSGPINERYQQWRDAFIIPAERLDTVFRAAIAEARRRTVERLELPEDERFELEYVTNKSWSGYNWYQGDARSLIQLNTDLPIHIDRAIDLAAHEGYPGHHVYNVLIEQELVRERGWPEFQVYPLFSPQSLIAEGSANYGIDVAFPGEERVSFEREVLYPLAGLDPARAAEYREIQALAAELSYAGNEAARRYLNGDFTREEAAAWLTRYGLMDPERALQRTRFMDDYRSYVINYNLGRDMVADYVERLGGTADDPERRWEVFGSLLASPRLPSNLRE